MSNLLLETLRFNKKMHIKFAKQNYASLRLCIKRDNLGIPVELWHIICGYIQKLVIFEICIIEDKIMKFRCHIALDNCRRVMIPQKFDI